MGQKVHPYGIRLGFTKEWRAKWYSKREYKELLYEDLIIRKKVKEMLKHSGVSHMDIERSAGRIRLKIYSARPGIVIGRKGQEIDKLRSVLQKISNKEIFIDIKEVKNPLINAQLVAENVAQQLEKRVSYRKAMKKAISSCLAKGGAGIKIHCAGRLGGAEIARSEGYKEGKVPLSTFRANVDYGFTEACTTYGVIGVKVWIYIDNNALLEPETTNEDDATANKKKRKEQKAKKTESAEPVESPASEEGVENNAVDAIEG